MSLDFCKQSLLAIAGEVQPLLDKHYDELTLNKDRVRLNPVWARYYAMEDAGVFHALTARLDGELVGYSGWIVQPHLHYADIIVAQNDVLYLRKDLRQGMTGVRFLRYAELEMRKLGAHKLTWHVKAANDFRPILHRMGYSDEDTICGKFL